MSTQKPVHKKQGKTRLNLLSLIIAAIVAIGVVTISRAQQVPPNLPEGVEYYENDGHEHLSEGKRSFYSTDPPTSGPHDPSWLPPSIYKAEETRPELLVHNLEHGNIVIYFNPDILPKADIEWLIQLARQYLGQWDGVLMVTRADKKHPLILSAWRANLRLEGLDKKRVLGFVDFFRGRGPENAVR